MGVLPGAGGVFFLGPFFQVSLLNGVKYVKIRQKGYVGGVEWYPEQKRRIIYTGRKGGQSGLEDSILPGAIAWLLLLFIEKQRIIKTSINRFE